MKKGEITFVGRCMARAALSALVPALAVILSAIAVSGQNPTELPYRICSVVEHPNPVDRVLASDNEMQFIFPVSAASLRNLSLAPFGNLWATAPGGTIEGVSVWTGSGIVYVLGRTGGEPVVTELSLETGLVRAVRRFPAPGMGDAVLTGDLIVAARAGSVAAFTPDLSRELWRVDGVTVNDLSSSLSAAGQTFFRVGERLVSVGQEGQKYEFAIAAETRLHAVTSDRDVLVGTDRGEAVLIDGRNGRRKWSFRTGGQVSSIVVYGGNALITSSDNFIYSVRLGNGGLNWKSRTTDRLLSRPAINGQIFVYINGLRGTVEIRSLSNGRLLSTVEIPGERRLITAAVSGESIAVFTSAATFLLADRCAPASK